MHFDEHEKSDDIEVYSSVSTKEKRQNSRKTRQTKIGKSVFKLTQKDAEKLHNNLVAYI